MHEGKETFYPKVYEALRKSGFQVFHDKVIPGKGRSHASKPDYIAVKGKLIVIGEIKAPAEPPTSSSWRQIQKSDGENFEIVRMEVAKRESAGDVSKEVGGHEIIIRGQIPDYYEKLGDTYDLPPSINVSGKIFAGFSFPTDQNIIAQKVLNNFRKPTYEKVDTGNGSFTIIF